ncbi:MAG: hypothetical protein ABI624_21930 [Casimicrobiaceae bacterium]
MTPDPDASQRDPALERAWRAHSRETPPLALDRAILAAAHRAVGSGPQEAAKAARAATAPQRWWMPLAAAAAVGIVTVGLLQVTPEQDLVAPNERVAAVARGGADERKLPAAPAGAVVSDTLKERDAPSQAARPVDTEATTKKKQEARQEAPAAVAVAPPPAAPPPLTQAQAPSEHEQQAAMTGRLSARAPASEPPKPFPAEEQRKNAYAEAKRDAPAKAETGADASAGVGARLDAKVGASASANAAGAKARAPAAFARSPPGALADEAVAARKDAAGERSQLAADKLSAAASPARTAPMSGGAVPSPAATPPPAMAPMPRARESGFARDEAPRQAAASSPAPAPAPAAAPAPAPAPMLAKTIASSEEMRAKARDPDAWIVRIRKLRDEGNTPEAMRELRAFRDLVPDADHRLPADLLAWANTFRP